MSSILKFDFQKRKQLRFFGSKLSKLHKKDPILHVTTTYSLGGKRGNKNKQWTHSTSLKSDTFYHIILVKILVPGMYMMILAVLLGTAQDLPTLIRRVTVYEGVCLKN